MVASRRLRTLIAVAAALGVATAPSGVASAAPKAPIGSFGLPTGPGGGQLVAGLSGATNGIAVNRTGAGGVQAGSVYVAEGNPNNRVQQFTAEGEFVRLWGYDTIVASRPDSSVPPNGNGTGFEICDATQGNVASDCQAAAGGVAAGQLFNPTGIAVDQSNGYVYVTSSTNRRVDVFSATGRFAGAFGWGVRTGAAALEICTTASGCRAAAAAGAQAGNFQSIGTAVAIDPSVPGRLSVGDDGNRRVDQYSTTITSGVLTAVSFDRAFGWDVDPAGGTGLESCTTVSGCKVGTGGNGAGQFTNGSPRAVAVDGHGAVYVASSPPTGACSAAAPCRVQKFSADLSAVRDLGPTSGIGQLTRTAGSANAIAPLNLATDPSDDHVFVLRRGVADPGDPDSAPTPSATGYQIVELDADGDYVETHPGGDPLVSTGVGATTGLAVGTDDRLYAQDGYANRGVTILGVPPAPEVSVPTVTRVGATTATFRGTVTPPAGGFGTSYYFEFSTNGITWRRWPATANVSVGSANVPVDVSQDVKGLAANVDYLVRLVATTGTAATSDTRSFTTRAAAPTVSGTFAESVDEGSAKLTASINPNHQETRYHFEWGLDTSYGSQSPADLEPQIGSGSELVKATGNLAGLQPGTVYHFRVVATNATGTTAGPDQRFMTLDRAGLPDGRGYELVSPASKGSANFVGTLLLRWVAALPASDGQSIFYPMGYGLPDATAGGDLRYLATRDPSDGWQSVQVTSPLVRPPAESGTASFQTLFEYLSDDLSCRVATSRDALAPDAPTAVLDAGGRNLYRQNPDGTYTALNPEPSNPDLVASDTSVDAGGYRVVGASDGCDRIVFEGDYTYPGVAASRLYEWDSGTLRSVATLPDGSTASDAVAGSRVGNSTNFAYGSLANVVSRDGSRVFFSATSNDGNDAGKLAVFVRKDGASTVKVSASKTATVDQGAIFQTASTDGSRVFFLANYGLTTTTSSGPTTTNCATPTFSMPAACDLYSFDVDSGDLTDLSADAAEAQGARVAGVLGASDDGAYVYFAAQGQLVPYEGRTVGENMRDGTYNVYLSHAGDLAYVGQIGQSQVQQAGATMLSRRNGDQTSQVTPDGRFLLFASMQDMTGYDSGGVNMAYLYSADTGETVCVSCRRDGRPSIDGARGSNVATITPLPAPQMYGMRRHAITERMRIRAISDDGSKVFFTSADPLAPGAVAGKPNVYAWQAGQVSLLGVGPDEHVPASGPGREGLNAFYGASASGDDAFLITDRRLVADDADDEIDLYDVRVGGGFPSRGAPRPVPCDPVAGGCQGPGAPQSLPIFETLRPFGAPPPFGGNVPASVRGEVSVKQLTGAQRAALSAGRRVDMSVKVNRQGTVSVKATARLGAGKGRDRTVMSAQRTATGGGAIALPVRLSQAARARLAAAGRLKIAITVRLSSVREPAALSLTLKKAKPKKPSTRSRSVKTTHGGAK